MPLYKYSELTDERKELVSKMYVDLSDVEDYLYMWDGDKYSGRQPVHEEIETSEPDKDELLEKLKDTHPVKVRSRKTKK